MKCEACGRIPAVLPLPAFCQPCPGGCGNPSDVAEQLHEKAVRLAGFEGKLDAGQFEQLARAVHEVGDAFEVEICGFCHAPAGMPKAKPQCLWPKHHGPH